MCLLFAEVLIEQIWSIKILNSGVAVSKNRFMGSIHASFDPNFCIFASPIRVFAISVNVRRGRSGGMSGNAGSALHTGFGEGYGTYH